MVRPSQFSIAYGTLMRAVAQSIRSISVASSASAFELLTRFDTGQRCSQDASITRLSQVTSCSPFSEPRSFLSTELPLRRRLLKMIGGLATCPKTIWCIRAPCWTRSSQPKSKLSDWSYVISPIGKATHLCSPAASPWSQCWGKPSNETIRPFART